MERVHKKEIENMIGRKLTKEEELRIIASYEKNNGFVDINDVWNITNYPQKNLIEIEAKEEREFNEAVERYRATVFTEKDPKERAKAIRRFRCGK